MKEYKNLFMKATEDELTVYYYQYMNFNKTGVLPDNELGKMRDEYCEFSITGLHIMEMDLLKTIADRWYSSL